MVHVLKRFWNEHPLLAIILIALIPRLIAAIFSKGYGMHDDHFGPIEQPFIIMHDISYWTSRTTPHGHSIVYPLIHYVLLNVSESLGIRDPQAKMYLVRLLHAIYSLLVVSFGYKIAETISNREIAKKAGLVLALFWAFPYLSVRNLIEMVCIPPLMAGFFYALRSKENLWNAFIAGLWFGLAFVFRYQTFSITATLGLVFLFRKEFKQMGLLVAGFFITAAVIQGSADIFAWGYPFASFLEYMRYNATHGYDYTTGPVYTYVLLVLGAFIPPMSFFLLYGFFRNWRRTLIVILPVLVFFISHSFFPNKQERFIFPVVPLILLMSVVGWEEFVNGSAFWLRHRAVSKSLWIWFWVINFILLVPFTTYYSKKSRVEAMYTLYGKQVSGIVLVGGKVGVTQPPLFYYGEYPVPLYQMNDEAELAQVKSQLLHEPVQPNYAVFFGMDDIDQRVQHIESSLKVRFILERRIEASFLDDVFYRLNPKNNKNETTFIYKVDVLK
jgi:Alg9-like mannosyltransferase family